MLSLSQSICFRYPQFGDVLLTSPGLARAASTRTVSLVAEDLSPLPPCAMQTIAPRVQLWTRAIEIDVAGADVPRSARQKKEQGIEPCSKNCVDPIYPQNLDLILLAGDAAFARQGSSRDLDHQA
jgi:hypothetical protein